MRGTAKARFGAAGTSFPCALCNRFLAKGENRENPDRMMQAGSHAHLGGLFLISGGAISNR
jgi:hypothetical protein